MYPILIRFGDFILPSWHFFFVLGAIGTYYLAIHLAKKHVPEVSVRDIARVYVICYISGYFGARGLSIFVDQPEITGVFGRLAALVSFGPMTFYGGFLFAAICGAAYVWWARLPLRSFLDIGFPSTLLGLAIGRVGCFLNGDDYGIPVSGAESLEGAAPFWAVVFPNLGDGIPRHAVQLYSTIAVGIFVGIVVYLFPRLRRRYGAGTVGMASVLGYSIIRFLLEIFRGDPRGWAVENALSTSQFISLLVAPIAIGVLFVLNRGAPGESKRAS